MRMSRKEWLGCVWYTQKSLEAVLLGLQGRGPSAYGLLVMSFSAGFTPFSTQFLRSFQAPTTSFCEK